MWLTEEGKTEWQQLICQTCRQTTTSRNPSLSFAWHLVVSHGASFRASLNSVLPIKDLFSTYSGFQTIICVCSLSADSPSCDNNHNPKPSVTFPLRPRHEHFVYVSFQTCEWSNKSSVLVGIQINIWNVYMNRGLNILFPWISVLCKARGGCATGVWDEKLKMDIKLTSFKAVQVNI